MGLIGIAVSFVPLLVLGAIIAGAVVLIRRRRNDEVDPGIGTLKRLYFYGISFAALMALATGLYLLIDSAGDAWLGRGVLFRGQSQLAFALALVLVGAPIWLFHWALAHRAVKQIPWETQALARRIYLHLVLAVSATGAGVGFVFLFRWWLGAGEFNGLHIALPLVWGVVWAFHWRQVDLEKQDYPSDDAVRPLYTYAASLAGLVMLLVGMGVMWHRVFLSAYDALFATELLVSTSPALWNSLMKTALAAAVTGGVLWWWHWRQATKAQVSQGSSRAETATDIRQVYLYVFAILAGSATVVVSLSIVLFRLLSWWSGPPDFASAGDYFRFLPNALSALVAGGGLWGYHWAVAQQESRASGKLPEARRVYRYLVAAVALGALGVGLVALLGVGAGSVLPLGGEELSGSRWWRGQLALGLTLLAVGGPLWAYHWFGAQREAVLGGIEELAALPRRVFVYLVFGVAVLIGLGSLITVLFLVLKGVLEADVSIAILQNAKLPLGMALVAGAIGVYHWLVLQEDRRALADAPVETGDEIRAPKYVIALVPGAAQPVIRRLEEKLGTAIRTWQRLDTEGMIPNLTDEDLDDARRRIGDAPGERILLTMDASGINVAPYRET